jgi:pyruvate formate lyase activating enzyme
VVATIECIETEAVNHFSPGSKILSLGNIGCMMSCSYCQNWQTSQVKHLEDKNVASYTPEEVIALAKANNVGIISWTYNDPVVWHEFVLTTSRLAKQAGIKTLYKSALYIEIAPLKELIEVIDIFSVSLKSMDAEIYKKYTKGRLEPVLNAIKEIGRSNRHLEISQLVVTGLNDDGTDAKKTARWIVDNLGATIPFHLVAYHPAYKYDKPRTSPELLLELRKLAVHEGIKHCYIGNVYSEDLSNTFCDSCHTKLVERFGLSVTVVGLDEESRCTKCNTVSNIKFPLEGQLKLSQILPETFAAQQTYTFTWNSEVNSLHIQTVSKLPQTRLKVHRLPAGKTEIIEMNAGLERVILSRSGPTDESITIEVDSDAKMLYLPVLDRAHFPVSEEINDKKYLN